MNERPSPLFIYARIIVAFIFLLLTVVLNSPENDQPEMIISNGVIWLMLFSFLFSLLSHLLFRYTQFQSFILYLQSIWDLLFVTLLILFTGGIASPYSFLYLLSIMNAALFFGMRESLYTASLCSILYGAIIDFQYFGMLEKLGISSQIAHQHGVANLVYTILINTVGFGTAAFITGYLVEKTKLTEEALKEKNIDYEELSKLNSIIVSNIDVGVITLNSKGLIKVFNPCVEQLTTLMHREVYGHVITEVFDFFGNIPDLSLFSGREFQYKNRDGELFILSFSISSFLERDEKQSGFLLVINDVTELRKMAEALKKQDRMAALGEVSSRMAHEIRNPLASMSGAAQMIAADLNSASEAEQRLLNIVIRESERLNSLITDFLVYARPSELHKSSFLLHELIEDILFICRVDPRYRSILLHNLVKSDLVLNADQPGIRQVILNLLHNSADAMPEGGEIIINANRGKYHGDDAIIISIIDDGAGISENIMEHIFEPFWTTKTQGSGLGLAVSYRIAESHGGTLSAKNFINSGCEFSIILPA